MIVETCDFILVSSRLRGGREFLSLFCVGLVEPEQNFFVLEDQKFRRSGDHLSHLSCPSLPESWDKQVSMTKVDLDCALKYLTTSDTRICLVQAARVIKEQLMKVGLRFQNWQISLRLLSRGPRCSQNSPQICSKQVEQNLRKGSLDRRELRIWSFESQRTSVQDWARARPLWGSFGVPTQNNSKVSSELCCKPASGLLMHTTRNTKGCFTRCVTVHKSPCVCGVGLMQGHCFRS